MPCPKIALWKKGIGVQTNLIWGRMKAVQGNIIIRL